MKSLAFFGIALLLGLSIGGLLVRYGASQADYYSVIIGLALQRKAHMAQKAREPFSRRVGPKRWQSLSIGIDGEYYQLTLSQLAGAVPRAWSCGWQ